MRQKKVIFFIYSRSDIVTLIRLSYVTVDKIIIIIIIIIIKTAYFIFFLIRGEQPKQNDLYPIAIQTLQ